MTSMHSKTMIAVGCEVVKLGNKSIPLQQLSEIIDVLSCNELGRETYY